MNMKELWEQTLSDIELKISKPNFLTWFKNTSILSKNEKGVIELALPNNFAKEWIKNRYHKLILGSLRTIDSSIKNIEYVIGAEKPLSLLSSKKTTKIVPEVQASLIELKTDPKTNLNPRYTFKSFIVGSSNELAFAASEAVVKNVGQKYNPLFVYGGVGLGKTHLLQAIGNEIKRLYKNKIKVLYVTSEKFLIDVLWAIRNKKMDDIKKKYRTIDVLVIDDIHFIGGKAATEEEFFHTFNVLHENNKQIILSSDRAPGAIPTLHERLKSRFEAGMIADLTPPNYEMRLAILKTKVQENKWELEEKILETIAEKVKKNIRELEGVLNKAFFYQEVKGERISISLIEKIINEITQVAHKNISPDKILKNVADFFDVSIQEILSKSKRKELVEPRQIIMHLLREILNASYPFIGRKLGNRDHTTVIYACKKISQQINKDPVLSQKINLIKEEIHK